MEKLILSLILVVSVNSSAEVYRWTDANGKVHFGDQKPKATAENITAKVKATNVDTSTNEHQKLETMFRKENDADREISTTKAKAKTSAAQSTIATTLYRSKRLLVQD